jgi:hypothetical protein
MEARRVGGCAWSMARDDAEPNKTACGSEEQEPWVVSRNLCKRLVFFLAEIRPSGSLNRISFRIVFPPEPPVAICFGPERSAAGSRARRRVARRSEPLPASTVLASLLLLDGRRSGNRSNRDSRWWAQSESGCPAESSFDPISPENFKLIQRLFPLLNQVPFGAHIL